MKNPLVSVIVPARNAQRTITICIESVIRLDYPNYDVIVVDDGSHDQTGSILSRYNTIKIVTTEGIGPSAARNIALQQSQAEFVAFTDADCIVEKDWLQRLLEGFTSDRIMGVGGIQKSPDDDSPLGKNIQEFLRVFGFLSEYVKSNTVIRQTTHNPSCNVMYRRSIVAELDGFMEYLWPGEDVELDYRIKKRGYQLVFNPEAVVYHYRNQTVRGFGKMMFRYGYAQGFLARKYGFVRIVYLEPVLLFLLVLLFLWNRFWAAICIAAGMVGIILKLIRDARQPWAVLSLSLVAMMNWNTGFIIGVIRNRPQQFLAQD